MTKYNKLNFSLETLKESLKGLERDRQALEDKNEEVPAWMDAEISRLRGAIHSKKEHDRVEEIDWLG